MDLDAMVPRALVDPQVRFAPVPRALPGGRRLTEWMTATADAVLVEQAGIRVLIQGTEDVWIDVDDGADRDLLGPIMYGVVVRTLLLHAGTFTLHASVVRHGETVAALAGHSGAGKSTTAAVLSCFHGASLLVDDLVPTRVVDGRAQVQPFERPVHLTVETIDRLGLRDGSDTSASDTGASTPGPRGKVAVPASRFGAAPVPSVPAGSPAWVELDRLVTLSVADDTAADDAAGPHPADVSVREISGAERLRWIVRLSNATGLASLGARGADYFEWSTAVANALDMVAIVRPDGADTLDEVCDVVLSGARN